MTCTNPSHDDVRARLRTARIESMEPTSGSSLPGMLDGTHFLRHRHAGGPVQREPGSVGLCLLRVAVVATAACAGAAVTGTSGIGLREHGPVIGAGHPVFVPVDQPTRGHAIL